MGVVKSLNYRMLTEERAGVNYKQLLRKFNVKSLPTILRYRLK